MTQEQFTEWLKERNKAVATLNLKTFKTFYRKWQKRGVYTEPMPDDRVLEMAICKMALAITPMPLSEDGANFGKFRKWSGCGSLLSKLRSKDGSRGRSQT